MNSKDKIPRTVTGLGFVALISLLLISLYGARGTPVMRLYYKDTVFSTDAIVSTASDTSEWFSLGDSQYQTIYISADSVGGAGTVGVDLKYELSRDGSTVAWYVGDTAAKTLISGFTGYDYTEYYYPLTTTPAYKIRFIATGTASNSAYTLLTVYLVRQP